jgi:hypothetical protein
MDKEERREGDMTCNPSIIGFTSYPFDLVTLQSGYRKEAAGDESLHSIAMLGSWK